MPSLLALLLCIIMGLLLGTLLTLLLNWSTGFEMMAFATEDFAPTAADRILAKMTVLIHHLCTFLLPGLAAAILLYRRDWGLGLSLGSKPKTWNLLLTGGLMLLIPPLVALLYWVNKQIPLPSILSTSEAQTNQLIEHLLVVHGPGDFLLNLLIIAIIPAIGEEFIFRGHLQQIFGQWTKSPHWGIWLAAIVFSAIHMQFEGFLPRMVLGAVLGYCFYFTGNLWIAIWGHFVNNAFQLLAALQLSNSSEALVIGEVSLPSGWQFLIFTTLAGLIFFRLYRNNLEALTTIHERT